MTFKTEFLCNVVYPQLFVMYVDYSIVAVAAVDFVIIVVIFVVSLWLCRVVVFHTTQVLLHLNGLLRILIAIAHITLAEWNLGIKRIHSMSIHKKKSNETANDQQHCE